MAMWKPKMFTFFPEVSFLQFFTGAFLDHPQRPAEQGIENTEEEELGNTACNSSGVGFSQDTGISTKCKITSLILAWFSTALRYLQQCVAILAKLVCHGVSRKGSPWSSPWSPAHGRPCWFSWVLASHSGGVRGDRISLFSALCKGFKVVWNQAK